MKFSSSTLILLSAMVASKKEYTAIACPFATLFGEASIGDNEDYENNLHTQFLRSSSSETRHLEPTACTVHLQAPSVSLGQMARTGNKAYDAFAKEVYKELRRQALYSQASPGFVADVTPQALIRLAFHECIPFGQRGPGLGGSNGSIQRELELPNNARLGGAYNFLEALLEEDGGSSFSGITLADAPHIAAAVAVQAYGGPSYSVNFGRPVDFTDEDTCDADSAGICWPPPVPPPIAGADHAQILLGFYQNAGFTDPVRALVASSGAHTLGGIRAGEAASFDFTTNSYTFDNSYFTMISDFFAAGAPGFKFFADIQHSPNGCPVALLPSDVVLGDPRNVDMRALVEEYAMDQAKWFEEYSGFMQECSLKGVEDPDSLTSPV